MAASGARRATGRAIDRIVSSLKALEGDETLCVQSGKPVGIFKTHRGRAARADRQFQHRAALGDARLFQRARSQGPDDVRPDDRGLVDLYRHAGHRAGHLRDLRRGRPAALSAATSQAAGFSPPASAAWAARSRSPRPWRAPRCSRSNASPRASRCGCAPAMSTCRPSIARRGADHPRARRQGEEGGLGRACSAMRPRCYPELVRRGVKPDAVTDQTSAHDPINGYLPAGWTLAEWQERRERDPKAVEQRREGIDGRACARDARFLAAGHADARLRQQHPPDGARHGREGCVRFPGLRAGLHPSAVLPRRRAVPLGRAVGRSRRTSTRPTQR